MSPEKVIIFGGSSGIGEASAKKLSEKNFNVIIIGRDKNRLEEARKRISAEIEIASVDATDRVSVERFFEKTGSFSHLVLSHSGGKGAGLFKTVNVNDIRSGLEEKLLSQISVAQSALDKIRPDGSITFISAASARTAIPGTSGLAAINGAIDAMIPAIAKELAPIRVNAVSPGIIDTPWWNNIPKEAKDAFFQQASQNLPVHRVGKPEDVALAVVYLIENSFVTGTVLEVDGGSRLH